MSTVIPPIESFWQKVGFQPNEAQRQAIQHVVGPLYLPAGPGSGKTRVLLWRTFNLIVYHGVDPRRIFLSTFTQKAAKQLLEGLQTLLTYASDEFHRPYEINDMYVGTIHSLCQKLLQERAVSSARTRIRPPVLLDELSQFFYLYQNKGYADVLAPEVAQVSEPQMVWSRICSFLGKQSSSKFEAVTKLVSFFNRLSEEAPVLDDWRRIFREKGEATAHTDFMWLLDLYERYQKSLAGPPYRSDLSLLQRDALWHLEKGDRSADLFEHVIIDEYQDTNTVQERLVFLLASKSKNLCVVGDDDQALYRFRGATVENFVQFPNRVQLLLGVETTTIPLVTNYRSRQDIVTRYGTFMDTIDWTANGGKGSHRVPKVIQAHHADPNPRVYKSTGGALESSVAEIVDTVERLVAEKVVEDPCQIAFLFPSLTSRAVDAFQNELEARGLKVYAPRAHSFLETKEAKGIFGLLGLLLGEYRPGYEGRVIAEFRNWVTEAIAEGQRIMDSDPLARALVDAKRKELETCLADHRILMNLVEAQGWNIDTPALTTQLRTFMEVARLSSGAKKTLGGKAMSDLLEKRRKDNNPLSLRYVLSSATSVDWTLLDLFYRFCGLTEFKSLIDESGDDEGPLFNLSYVGQFINKYAEEYKSMISAFDLEERRLVNSFFGSYLFVLFRKKEREFENDENPFPRGRIPFLTIHQSKGLEFPVVVLGNLRKKELVPTVDHLLEPLLADKEPLDRQPLFDAMRKFYVAMSRAEQLLIIHHGKGLVSANFRNFVATVPELSTLNLDNLSKVRFDEGQLPRSYSFTGDFNFYRQCPRQYQIFQRFSFPPSRSQTMAFGSLVHQTLEDLHEFLIARREANHG